MSSTPRALRSLFSSPVASQLSLCRRTPPFLTLSTCHTPSQMAYPRHRQALSAYYSTTRPRFNSAVKSSVDASEPESQKPRIDYTKEPRLSMTFTCTVPECGTRSSHTFTKRAYEKGIVLVECPGCHNRHLIADNLGWFKDSTEEGKMRNVEDFMKMKGELVRRGKGTIDGDGNVVEYVD